MTIKTQPGFNMRPGSVVVLRVSPSHHRFASALECIEQLVKKGYGVWVFLHGPAVGPWLEHMPPAFVRWAEDDAVTVSVCQAAWHRSIRDASDQNPSGQTSAWVYPESSLIQMWQRILQAERVDVFGGGLWPSDWPEPKMDARGAYGVMIAYEADEADQLSQLEWVLAGSALELDLVVAFAHPELKPSRGPNAARWGQLLDHKLASVISKPQDMPTQVRFWMVL